MPGGPTAQLFKETEAMAGNYVAASNVSIDAPPARVWQVLADYLPALRRAA